MEKIKNWFYVALPILGIVLLYALSWITTCGLIKLITICFGLTFSWGIATGIWLVLCILRSMFGRK